MVFSDIRFDIVNILFYEIIGSKPFITRSSLKTGFICSKNCQMCRQNMLLEIENVREELKIFPIKYGNLSLLILILENYA